MKKIYVAFLMTAAVVIGHYIGNSVIGTEGLGWLGYSKPFGFPATSFTFGGVIDFTIGLSFNFNIAQIILVITGIFIYTKTAPKIFK